MRDIYQSLPLIHIFRVVAEKGSFQDAALALKLSRSSVSKKIQQLEDTLNQPVFVRSTRKLLLTDFGSSLLEGSKSMSGLLEQVDRITQSNQLAPSGTVRISSSVLIGQIYLIPLLAGIKSTYPNIMLDISFNDETVDFYEEGIDIALRLGFLPDSSLVAKKVGEKTWGWFASPQYLAQHGVPPTPESLMSHACLSCRNKTQALTHWSFKNTHAITTAISINPTICTDSSSALVNMAAAGLGVVMVDALMIQQELKSGSLVRILEDWSHPDTIPIHLISLSKSQRSRAADCVWRYLAQRLVIQAK